MNTLCYCKFRPYFPCSIYFSSLWVEVFLYFHLIILRASQTNFASHFSCKWDLHFVQLPPHISMTTWYTRTYICSELRNIYDTTHLNGIIHCPEHNTSSIISGNYCTFNQLRTSPSQAPKEKCIRVWEWSSVVTLLHTICYTLGSIYNSGTANRT